jgi:hypothetical protein
VAEKRRSKMKQPRRASDPAGRLCVLWTGPHLTATKGGLS